MLPDSKVKAELNKSSAFDGAGGTLFSLAALLLLFSENVATFDAGPVPATVLALATGFSAFCQSASAVNAWSAVLAGPFFKVGIGPVILTPVDSGSRSASILYANLAPFNAQSFFSSSLNLLKDSHPIDKDFLTPNARWFFMSSSLPQQSAVRCGVYERRAFLQRDSIISKLYANE